MKINPPVLGNREKTRGNNLAVSDDNNDVGSQPLQELRHFRSANFFRLMHRKMRGECDLFHRRDGKLLTAAARSVGLGDDGDNLKI